MGKWSDPSLTAAKATLIAEYHDDVDGILDAYARSSRANTSDRPQDAPTPGWDA